jgi:site-specific DNA recombinase
MSRITAMYARVSTQEQAREGYSIDEQASRLNSFCDIMGWKERRLYTDAGFSGGNTDRPALQQILKDIHQGKICRVVVYKLDRLSRSQKDTLELIEDQFLRNDVDFTSITENFDTGTPFGRAMIGVLAVFAQLEREQIKERMNMGRAARAKTGKYHGGGHILIGYTYQDGKLSIDEYEAMQIREMFDLYSSGVSIRKIESIFYDKGYSHKYGKWRIATISRCLTNSTYTGKVSFAGQTYDGDHEAIIPQELFDRVQEIHEKKKRINNKDTWNRQLLSGLIYCGQCGARYAVARRNGKNTIFYYNCYSRRKFNRNMIKDPNCKNKIYRADVLDKIILDEIRKLKADPEAIANISRQSQNEPESQDRARIIQQEIKAAEKQISRFLDLYGLGTFTTEELTEKTEPIIEKKKKLTAELEEIQSNNGRMTAENATQLIKSFDDIIKEGSKEEIRLLVESLIDRIEIDNEDITIYWAFS